jgi:hypothetical protein
MNNLCSHTPEVADDADDGQPGGLVYVTGMGGNELDRMEPWYARQLAAELIAQADTAERFEALRKPTDDDAPCWCGVAHTRAEHGYDPDKE